VVGALIVLWFVLIIPAALVFGAAVRLADARSHAEGTLTYPPADFYSEEAS
jgi:hypothetical protein